MTTRDKRLTPAERRRRRRRRLTLALGYILVAFGVAWYFESQATTTVVFVRHADVDNPLELDDDPPLNATGRARADLLSRFLQYLDVVGGVNAIYAEPTRRARETAAPLAARLELEILPAEFDDTEEFMEDILQEHKGEIVLFVVDREAIAPMIEELHGSKRVPEIAPDEYENLYVVTVPWGGGAKVKTLRMLYGLDWKPPEATRTSRGDPALELR
jgi:phosphohistidine phosphatase SixA